MWAFLVRCGPSPPSPPLAKPEGGDKSRGIYRKSRGISPEGRGGTNPEASKNLKRKPCNPWLDFGTGTFYRKMLNHDYTTKEVLNKNFFKDWRKVMTEHEKEIIRDLSKCDFSEINEHFKKVWEA